MKPKDDEYIYDNFVLKKLTSNNLDEIKPEDIVFEDELKKWDIQGMAELYGCWVEIANKIVKENGI